jgi:hypothetical protein
LFLPVPVVAGQEYRDINGHHNNNTLFTLSGEQPLVQQDADDGTKEMRLL